MAVSTLPTLSEVRAFTGEYLIDAATHWSDSAIKWSDASDGLNRDVRRPAGSDWTGKAAESAASRVGADGRRVTNAADDLTAAAGTARLAADDLQVAKTRLLSTVHAAEVTGIEVGEDFSLTTVETTASATELAAREAQMRSFATAIRSRVLALVNAVEHPAVEITRVAERLRSLVFDDAEAAPDRNTLLDTIKIEGPLADLDWARDLFLTEASFGSELVGTGWEWEIGQSGSKDLLVLRSLQDKIHTDERSRLLQENVNFTAPRENRVGMRPRVHTNSEPLDLSDDERLLMSATIGAYVNSPMHGFGVLAPIAGQPTFATWVTYIAKLHEAVAGGEDLVDLDWMPALFLTDSGLPASWRDSGRNSGAPTRRKSTSYGHRNSP